MSSLVRHHMRRGLNSLATIRSRVIHDFNLGSPSVLVAHLTTNNQRGEGSRPSNLQDKDSLLDGVMKWIPGMPTDESKLDIGQDDPDYHATELDWTNRINRILDEGNVQEAETTLNKSIRLLGSDHEEWIKSNRLRLLNAWVEIQDDLLEKLNEPAPDSSSMSMETKQQLSADRKLLVRGIASAAESAHSLLEKIEPFLGTRHSPSADEKAEPDPSVRSSNNADATLSAACHSVLLASAKAVRASYTFHNVYRVRGLPQRAQFLHDRMRASSTLYPPTDQSYKLLFEIWAYSFEHLRATSVSRVVKDRLAEDKLSPMDVQDYRLVMMAFALSDERRAASQATQYLKKMLHIAREVSTDSETDRADNSVERATVEDYHAVMRAWARSEGRSSPYIAKNLLDYLEGASKEDPSSVTPDTLCYQYALQAAAAKSDQEKLMGDLVDSILTKMRDAYIVPDAFCFTYAIRTWKNAAFDAEATAIEKEKSVRRALELLTEMDVAHNQSTSVEVFVSTENINDALEALTVSDNPKKTEIAEALLIQMEEAIDEKNFQLIPDSASYLFALRVWSSVWAPTRMEEAKKILDRMMARFDTVSRKSRRRRDSIAVFNEFIKLCGSQRVASQDNGIEVLREAMDAVQSIRSLAKLTPDASTYAALLGACKNVLNDTPARSDFVQKIFKQCCIEGMVDEQVLQKVKDVISSEEYSDLVISQSEDVEGVKLVPEAWTARALRGSTITADGRRTVPLGIDGRLTFTRGMLEFQMRRLRDKRNQKLLRGGRLHANRAEKQPWSLYKRRLA